MHHTPVMCREVIEFLAIDPKGLYIDATFGRGGHSRAILERLDPEGFLLAIDKDTEAQETAQRAFSEDTRFRFKQGSFANLVQFAKERDWIGKVNGIVFDLGVSSAQLEVPERGFSFMQDGPLDMRMDKTVGTSVSGWIARAKEREIADVLWRYGEERFAKRIARAIVSARKITPIVRTLTLAKIISGAVSSKQFNKHPATRSFQAIRIFINQELEDLKKGLIGALEVLKVGGRLVVISFHSLEDRIVKQFMLKAAGKQHGEMPLPAIAPFLPTRVRVLLLAKGRPTQEEIRANPRARSALMRVVEKI